MYVLYFTIFTGIESVMPGMSDLGVMIIIGFWYVMQRDGKEESEEVSSPDVHKSTLHGDMVPSLTRPHNGMKTVVMGYLPHYLLLWEWPELLIDLFPMMRAKTRFRWVPAYVEEVWNGFKRGCNEALCPSKNERDRPRRNYDYLQAESNWCREMGIGQRLTCFKEEGRWIVNGTK